jgi:predicted PurR-regulated permease PerM
MIQKSIENIPRQVRLALFFPAIYLNGWLLLNLLEQLQPLATIVPLAALLAFLLDYPIRRIQKFGIPRTAAIILVLALALGLFLVLAFTLFPLIFEQANELLASLPTWLELGKQQLETFDRWVDDKNWPVNLDGITTQVTGQLATRLQAIGSQALNVAWETIGSLVNIFLTIVFTIVLVFYGGKVWHGILSWLPTWWRDRVQGSFGKTFSNFIAGQTIMAAILTLMLTTALILLDAPYGLLFGIGIGLMSLIPFGGATGIFLFSLLLMSRNFWLGLKVLAIAAALLQINDNFVAPRVLGNLVGLNPFWLLISLFIGAKLGGSLGIFLAIPIASFIKSLIDATRNPNPELDRDAEQRQPT